jgi:hypothetical protein
MHGTIQGYHIRVTLLVANMTSQKVCYVIDIETAMSFSKYLQMRTKKKEMERRGEMNTTDY